MNKNGIENRQNTKEISWKKSGDYSDIKYEKTEGIDGWRCRN